ncbi:MAG TPA: hypothetical protein PLL33_02155 [Paracoccus sp. (in: a-proteobacteria)]|nr:hypothetical protein [Paracoccus sp. (in: a-proteobacteria)]
MRHKAILWSTILAALALAAQAQVPAVTDTQSVHDPADLKPEAPMPPDALVPGAPGVTAILCSADPPPLDASGALGAGTALSAPAADRRVRVDWPWAARPVMTGVGAPVEVRFFKRGRTLIFDAGAETLYVERDHRGFTYTASRPGSVITWHGTCRAMVRE